MLSAAAHQGGMGYTIQYCKESYFRTNFRDKNKGIAVYSLAGWRKLHESTGIDAATEFRGSGERGLLKPFYAWDFVIIWMKQAVFPACFYLEEKQSFYW